MIKLVTVTLLTATTFQIFNAVNEFHSTFPQPLQIKEDVKLTETRLALKLLKAPNDKLEKLTKSCYSAGFATDIDPILIASVMVKESEFNIKAKSKLGYKGLMQTKNSPTNWNYAEDATFKGACKLREKIEGTNGNVDKAMIFYKGHGGQESQILAKEQMIFYRKIREQVKEQMKGIS